MSEISDNVSKAANTMSEVPTITSISGPLSPDEPGLSISEFSDFQSAIEDVSARGPSVKSTVSNIEKKNPPPLQNKTDNQSEEASSVRARSIEIVDPQAIMSEGAQREHLNRSIEIQSALPVRTLGRQSAPEQKPEIDAEQINNSPFNVMLNEEDYGDMSNEEVMAALRQMATNAMAQAANKAATQEVLGRAVSSNQEQEEEEEVVLPIIEVTKPKLSVERQIQVHDDVIVEKEEPEVVEVVISNVQFDEQVLNDETEKVDLSLPDVFPGAEPASGEFDISKLTRTMTMNSQKRLISAETMQAKAEEDSKSAPKKTKKEIHIKQSYRNPGCCVAFFRFVLTAFNFLAMICGVVLLVLGVMGQIKFHTAKMKTENVITDPSFILLVAALISIVVSFNGGFGFFRGNVIMMRFFGWMLTAIFLCIFIGGIIVWAMAETIQEKDKIKQLYFHFIKMRVSNTGSSFFALETVEGYFRCCGVLSRADYAVQSLGFCDAKEIHLNKCAPPSSCCPSGLECDMTEAYEVGCVKKMARWTSDNTATLAGLWVLIWVVIVFEIVAVAHSVRRLNLQSRWQKLYGHLEEEEKLRARIAKKQKQLTQIEMDVHVQDIG